MSRKMLIKVLKKDGHTCDEAEDGLDAVAKVKDDMATPFRPLSHHNLSDPSP